MTSEVKTKMSFDFPDHGKRCDLGKIKKIKNISTHSLVLETFLISHS